MTSESSGTCLSSRCVFPQGVASGDITSRGVVLWTRIEPDRAGDRAEVTWFVATDAAEVVRTGRATADPASDHCISVEINGLVPGTGYTYGFEFGDARIEGRTLTLPEHGERFRFAVLCCSRWGWPGFDLFDSILHEQPALLLHLGDSMYEIGETAPNGMSTDPPHDCHTLDDYRRRHRQYRDDARLRRLLAEVPMIAIWDDHEVADNAPDPDSRARRRAGMLAWTEWMPVAPSGSGQSLDRQVSIGGLMDLAVVDSRFEGRSASDVDGPGDADDTVGGLLSDEQWNDLERFVGRAEAPWFVFANQVQVSPMTLAVRPAIARPPWRRVVNPDQWDGYPADRDRLASILRRAVGRTVVLSGDLHSAWSRTWADDHGPVAREFTCPSISGVTFGEAVRERLPLPVGVIERWLGTINRGIDHLDLDTHGYLVCDVTPDRFTTTVVSADGDRREFVVGQA